jgi:hypothetical protein
MDLSQDIAETIHLHENGLHKSQGMDTEKQFGGLVGEYEYK